MFQKHVDVVLRDMVVDLSELPLGLDSILEVFSSFHDSVVTEPGAPSVCTEIAESSLRGLVLLAGNFTR